MEVGFSYFVFFYNVVYLFLFGGFGFVHACMCRYFSHYLVIITVEARSGVAAACTESL